MPAVNRGRSFASRSRIGRTASARYIRSVSRLDLFIRFVNKNFIKQKPRVDRRVFLFSPRTSEAPLLYRRLCEGRYK